MPRPPDGHAAPGDARGHDDREQKLDALRTRVQAEAGGIRTADDWARSLHAAALLRESFANSLLILAQRPDATLVKGYEDWRKTGRQVIRREPGIEIFSRAPGKTGPSAPQDRPGPRPRRGRPELARCHQGRVRVGHFPDQRPARRRPRTDARRAG